MTLSGHPRTCGGVPRRDSLLWGGMGGGEVENYCSHFIAMKGGPVVAGAPVRGLKMNLTARKTYKRARDKSVS